MNNNISHIQNEQGAKIETHEGIESEFLNYFKQAHQEPNIDKMPAIDKILRNIPKLISEEHNHLLLIPVDLQKVEEAVRQLKAGKAPGPDGFTSNFFHNFWDLIKLEIWQVVEESRTLRWMFPGLNATFIALIPKEAELSTPDKYRPIALCNIIYKIVSKIIASRLKLLLPLIISPEKSGYVEGRQITNGIILTHEIIHSLKQSKKPAFGFAPPWVRWVMCLLSSSFFSVLINDIPSPTFRPSRGIRQGDPLSPFLFVIMAEGLGRSIKTAQQSQLLQGLSFHNSPTFSHQQFVDDNMLFDHPSVQEARQLKSLLSDFSEASGAHLNKIKSQILFFNTLGITQAAIACILGSPLPFSLPNI
eukprot:PITA_30007